MKKYPVKAPYQKKSDNKPNKVVPKIFPSREMASRLERRNVKGKRGK